MDYRGSAGNDDIDQRRDGIPQGAVIYGGDGDDTIGLDDALADGGRGNDTIVNRARGWATAVYWDSPAGVRVDLGQGWADDGFGTRDTLVGIRVVQGSGFDDTLVGGAADEFFYGGAGDNTVRGGAGFDTVDYYFEPSTAARVSYDAATDTFTVVKRFANGDRGTDTLSGIEKIAFSGPGSDDRAILRSDYVGDFRTAATVHVAHPDAAGITQLKAGDFNGDGHVDFAYVTQVGTGTAPAPTYFYAGDGKGGFADATTALLGQVPMKIVGGGRSIVADFNGDGADDLYQLDFGDDAPPFAGGIGSLYLSDGAGRLVDASATLVQRRDLSHGGSAGDVDGDGDIDLLVNTLDKGNLLLLNDGRGHFVERNELLPRPGTTLGNVVYQETSTFSGMVDVDGDGYRDLILGTWDGNLVGQGSKVLFNDGHGDFTRRAPVVLPASGLDKEIVLEVEAIDLNGDAYPDLMLSVTNGGDNAVFYHTDYIQLLVNDGSGHFRDETARRLPQDRDSSQPGWLMSLSAVDFNHDGHPDILAESAGEPITSKVYLNRGDGSFALDWESDPGGRAFAADVDGDGMSDVVAAAGHDSVSTWINHLANGHVYAANFGGDTLRGSSGADRFVARDGVDVFDGAGGLDTAVFAGARAAYAVDVEDGVARVDGAGTHATLAAIERVRFADGALALDIDGAAGQAYRVYQAALGRVPDAGGLGFWIAALDNGTSLDDVAAQFVASAEFRATYGALDDDGFLATVYRNILGRDADDGGFAFWRAALDHGYTRAQLVAQFSESAENQLQVAGAIAHGIAYQPYG
ncbi:FG-GAP-like repeat-containing protein [uncultured Massilia sp.]|uniref:FG-GAP-like repeat-containing protein n=1 Tax=uncultured Massilia sp. TaxID=169973 RepID=UPI0025E99E65|nr:FG-GAP-like repeat-containing protein [uncultured Massilia sp.]